MDNKILVTSFRNVSLAGLYIFGISQFLFYAENFFPGPKDSNLIPFVMLLLLSLSAATVGSLIFGQAVMLFLQNKRVEGIKSAVYSVAWLFVLTAIVLTTLVIIK